MYRALGKCKERHHYFQGCKLLLQWLILIHLAKGNETQELHILENQNTLRNLNDMLLWANLENRRTRERWAQIFSELREEDLQWVLDRFISKDVVMGAEDNSCFHYQVFGKSILTHPSESYDSLGGGKSNLERRTTVPMCIILGMTWWITLQKC